MAYIGDMSWGGYARSPAANEKWVTKFTAGSTFTAVKMGVLLDTGGSGQKIKGVIYEDDEGAPGNLLGQTVEMVADGLIGAQNWYIADLVSGVSISNGVTYWIGMITDSALVLRAAGITENTRYNSDTYSDGPSDPFGTPSSNPSVCNVWAGTADIWPDYVGHGNFQKGGAVVTRSTGVEYVVFTLSYTLTIARKQPGGMWVIDAQQDSADIFTSGGTTQWVHAALDGLDRIHCIAASGLEATRDVAYRAWGGSGPYYFNDSTPDDPQGVWTDDANAFDGEPEATYAYATTTGSTYYLQGDGTDAPAGSASIDGVKVRFYGSVGTSTARIQILDGAEVLFSQALDSDDLAGLGFASQWFTLSTPSGGWSWSKVQGLSLKIYRESGDSTIALARGEVVVLHDGWDESGWVQCLDYTEEAPLYPGCAISIDTSDIPCALVVDRVKVQGSTQDNIYYTDLVGGSWCTPEQVGARATKSDVYQQPRLSLDSGDDVHAWYNGNISGTNYPCYRKRTNGSWGGEDAGQSLGADNGLDIAVIGTTPHLIWSDDTGDMTYGTDPDAPVDTGYDSRDNDVRDRKLSLVVADSTQYLFFIAADQDVQLISNDGGGWTNEGDLHEGSYVTVVAEWAYTIFNPVDELPYAYSNAADVWFGSFAWGEIRIPKHPAAYNELMIF